MEIISTWSEWLAFITPLERNRKLSSAHTRVFESRDRGRVLAVHRDAFGEEGEVISNLVVEMLDDVTAEPVYSFVAEHGDQIVGHVLFTSVRVEPVKNISAQILAPLAVTRDQQKSGVGTKLVKDALDCLRENGVELVFVLGYPEYYSRFGFAPAGARGLQAPYPIPAKNADAWMVKEICSGALERCEGTVLCCDALSDPQYWQE